MKTIYVLMGMVAIALPAAAQNEERKKVMCTLPVLQVIAQEVAGDAVEVIALSKPDQDPHFVSPTPSLIKRLREADLFVEVGLSLEIWANELADNAGRPKLMRGGEARIVVSNGISRLEVPQVLSRSEGDVHPEGNPHIWLDPLRAKLIAQNIAQGLISILPAEKAAIEERLRTFQKRIDESVFGADLVAEAGGNALTRHVWDGTFFSWLEGKKLAGKLGGWMKKAELLRGQKVVEYHKSWIYLATTFGFEIVGSIQPKPGIEPGPKHLRELTEKIKLEKVRLILTDPYFNVSYGQSLAAETGAKAIVVPSQPAEGSYFKFMDSILDLMLEAIR